MLKLLKLFVSMLFKYYIPRNKGSRILGPKENRIWSLSSSCLICLHVFKLTLAKIPRELFNREPVVICVYPLLPWRKEIECLIQFMSILLPLNSSHGFIGVLSKSLFNTANLYGNKTLNGFRESNIPKVFPLLTSPLRFVITICMHRQTQ